MNKSIMNHKLVIWIIAILSLLPACGGGGTASAPASQTQSTSSPSTNNNLNFAFQMSLSLDSPNDGLDLDLFLDDIFNLPLSVNQQGTLTLKALQVPRIVYRVCTSQSNLSQCDIISDLVGFDLDIVIDSCGRFISDANCGSDTTQFTGSINNSTGAILINNVSIRLRAFAITNSLNGFNASKSAEGLIPLKRMIIQLTTGQQSSGALTISGSALNQKNATLVAAGKLASNIENLGNSDFIVILEGQFDSNPLSLISQD